MEQQSEISTTKKCPYCNEEILVDAVKCKHCGEFLDGQKKTSEKPKEGFFLQTMNFGCVVSIIILIATILCIVIVLNQ